MPDPARFCRCGCGSPLLGPGQRRYLDDAHQQRAWRARARARGQAVAAATAAPVERPELDVVLETALRDATRGKPVWLRVGGRLRGLSLAELGQLRAGLQVLAAPAAELLEGLADLQRRARALGRYPEIGSDVLLVPRDLVAELAAAVDELLDRARGSRPDQVTDG